MIGVVLGAFTWGTLAVIGVSALLALNPNVIILIQLFGGGYLMYLSLSSLRKALQKANYKKMKTKAIGHATILKGYTVHMTNPEAMMGWVALITLGLTDNAPSSAPLLILAGCFTIALCLYSLYAVLFSNNKVMQFYDSYGRILEGLFFIIFAFASLTLLMKVFEGFLR